MKKLFVIFMLVALFIVAGSSLIMAEVLVPMQVYSAASVSYGSYSTCCWNWLDTYNIGTNNGNVPEDKILEITTATINYFPTGSGTVGRIDICGRNTIGNAVWRYPVVYVEPKKTVHLTFPGGLSLGPGGYVEIFFTSEGPGTITVDLNGQLK